MILLWQLSDVFAVCAEMETFKGVSGVRDEERFTKRNEDNSGAGKHIIIN